MKNFAVLTGDIINSTALQKEEKELLISKVNAVLVGLEKYNPYKNNPNFVWYRGDSFQLVLKKPSIALRMALLIRTAIVKLGLKANDARIAIGIGTIDILTTQPNDSDGDAFRFSGRLLEKLPTEKRLLLRTKNSKKDALLNSALYFADVLVQEWSINKAEAVFYYLQGKTQEEIAALLNISQQAVNKRLRSANIDPVIELIETFENTF